MPDSKEDKMKEITEQLEQGVKDLFTTEQYRVYLKTMDKFHQYSFNNTVLIASQNPHATLVAGYKSWETNFNRHVRKGEHGIKIIAPMPLQQKITRDKKDEQTGNILRDSDGEPLKEEVSITIPRFRVVTVFDVSQTEGEPLPERPGVTMLTSHVEDYTKFMRAIKKVSPSPIRFSDEIEGTANGYYDSTNKEIVIRDGMSQSQTIKTAIHEVAHAKLHDPDELRKHGSERVDQTTREVQAESVAYVVLQHFGIDSSDYTFPYVSAWSSSVEMKELRESMDTIRHASSDIIEELNAQLSLDRETEKEAVSFEREPGSPVTQPDQLEYAIYQINRRDVPFEFMSYDFAKEHNMTISASDYGFVYGGTLLGVKAGTELDTLYAKFNIDKPDDFRGHSLSVSDVVIINHGGECQGFYVDSIGFTPLPNFVEELQQAQEQKDDMAKNIECKRAIEKAINENYNNKTSQLNTKKAVQSVVSEYGADRVQHVLAVTVQLKDWDGRFSPPNKAWAKELTADETNETDGIDTRNAYVIDAHPALLNGFIDRAREYSEVAQDKDQEKTVENFAERLDKFSQQYDLYNYKDNVESSEQHIQEIAEQVQDGNINGLRDWLQGVIDTSDDQEEIATAKALAKELNTIKGQQDSAIGNIVYTPAYDNGKWKVTEIDLNQARWIGNTIEYHGIAYNRDREMYTTETGAWRYINNDPTAYRDLVKFDADHKPFLASNENKMEEKSQTTKNLTIKEKLKLKQKDVERQDSWPDGQSGREELSL